jgi:hypothetical protein
VLYVDPTHKVYNAEHKKWIAIQEVTSKHRLLKNSTQQYSIDHKEDYYDEFILYDLSVADFHNYCVTPADIHVHNFIPIAIGLSFAFGGGAIEFVGATFGIGILTAAVGSLAQALLKKNRRGNQVYYTAHQPSQQGSMQGPEEEDDDENKNPHGRFEGSPKHHKNSKGDVSRAPKDGQKALDNSIPYSEESPHRIGISENEFVVLNRTREGIYHGHVRSWWKLTEDMRRELINHGLANFKGKIL